MNIGKLRVHLSSFQNKKGAVKAAPRFNIVIVAVPFPVAVAVAVLVVIPEGDLRLQLL
jgi:hypothetical protein